MNLTGSSHSRVGPPVTIIFLPLNCIFCRLEYGLYVRQFPLPFITATLDPMQERRAVNGQTVILAALGGSGACAASSIPTARRWCACT